MRVSVVIPAYNAEATLAECLRALAHQSLPASAYEVILVDDGSQDATAEIARRYGVQLITQPNRGAPAARNRGIDAAKASWVAFTDADCIPSRGWLKALLASVEWDAAETPLGAAGRTLGHGSVGPAARFVDLSGGLDAEHYLSHPRFPFAPSCNLIYRRDLLVRAGGLDERFHTYDACDLHTRLRRLANGPMLLAPRAVVLHRHRADWRGYFRQQRGYGYGYGQFAWRHRDVIHWPIGRELGEWGRVARLGIQAALPGDNDQTLLRRGVFAKALAQRLGFVAAYYDPRERRRW